jgi:hypothetical protein
MQLETTAVISKWTGPRTAAGKERSSMNAMKHGLTSRRVVLAHENRAEFDSLLKELLDDSQPVGTLEFELVNDIAAALWRLRRVRGMECDLAEVAFGLKTSKQAREEFSLMMRYTASIERELHRAIIRLNQVQELRHKRDARRRPANPPRALAMAQSSSAQTLTPAKDFVSSPDSSAPIPLQTDHQPPTTDHYPDAEKWGQPSNFA